MQTSFRRYFAFEAVPGTNGASKKGSKCLHQKRRRLPVPSLQTRGGRRPRGREPPLGAAKDHSRPARGRSCTLCVAKAGKRVRQRSQRLTSARRNHSSRPQIHHCASPAFLRRRRARHVEHTAEAEQRLRQTNGLLPLPTTNMPRPRARRVRVNAGAAAARRRVAKRRRRRAADVRNNQN